MSDVQPERSDTLARLQSELRRMSAQSVLFNQAVAERLGLNATDLRCGDIISRTGPITAGRLADLTGLTTGAITGIVDRLEEAGYVRRERDTQDRRRVLIQPMTERAEREIAPLYESLARRMNELSARYSEEELRTILDFVTRVEPILQEETARLRDEEPAENHE